MPRQPQEDRHTLHVPVSASRIRLLTGPDGPLDCRVGGLPPVGTHGQEPL
jgi:hypothetical protein